MSIRGLVAVANASLDPSDQPDESPVAYCIIRCGGWLPTVAYIGFDEPTRDDRLRALRASCRPGDGVSYSPDVCPVESDVLVDLHIRDAAEAVGA